MDIANFVLVFATILPSLSGAIGARAVVPHDYSDCLSRVYWVWVNSSGFGSYFFQFWFDMQIIYIKILIAVIIARKLTFAFFGHKVCL